MGLITKTVKVKWHGANRKHYENLGYEFTNYGDEFEIKVNDLPKKCKVLVDYCCDNCKKINSVCYGDYVRRVKENGKTYCKNCALKLYGGNNISKSRLRNTKSFYQWCIEHNRQDVLDRWDYELNDCSPKDICYSTNKKHWFKCLKHSEHKSELKKISGFTRGQEGSMFCNQCNSIAQYILDNFPNKDLYNVWDKEKNGDLNPWEVPKNRKIKIWIKCQNKYYHGSYYIECCSFCSGSRCHYCSNKNGIVHPKDSFGQYIIDKHGEEFLNKIWSKKNVKSPFEYAPNSIQKVWFNCLEKDYHDSYESSCFEFNRGRRCSYCSGKKVHPKDSLGQYIIDNYGEEFLSVWSDKNKKSPFEYTYKSSRKVWWKCQDELHEDFERNCKQSVKYEFRCPKCSEERKNSSLEEKTKLYLKELGYKVLTEYECTIRPVNPKTKSYMPYDNEIILENGKHLIIEVHGQQHYKEATGYYKNRLHKRQLYDRYKRIYCKHMNYEYLELPYWTFDKEETYKQMIDDKIKEILNISKTS